MTKKLYLPIVLLLAISMLLGACGPQATETPIVEAPVTQAPVVTEAPAFDVSTLLPDFWASVPADKGYGSVSVAKLSEELADKPPFILDIREPSELEEEGYIEGAINIPLRSVLQNLDKLPGLDEPIVVYCRTGHRGGLALMTLKLLGYTNVRNLGGGITAWKNASLPVVTGSLPVEPTVLGTPVIENEPLFITLDGFLTTLPEGFYTVKADGLATELADKPPFIVDVRSQAEWDKDGYIEGATLIPFSDFLSNLDKLPAEKDAPIVIYCASGHRGSMATMALHLLGYSNVVNLAGGLNGWKAASMPVAGWVDWATVLGEFVTNLPADQGYYTVKNDALNAMLAEAPVFLVDLREASEIETTGYIKGAINIPVRDLLKNLDKLPAKDQKLVIYCASGHRGALGMTALRMLGYTDVVNLAGGINGWTKASFALETGVPAAAEVLTASPEVDAARLTILDTYLSALPEGFGTVKSPDLNTEIASGNVPFIIDVRTEEEKTTDGYIEGSVLIPLNTVPANLAQLPTDKAAPIVVYCKSGHRAAVAKMYLDFLGYTNVRNLAGGISGWIAAELPVVK